MADKRKRDRHRTNNRGSTPPRSGRGRTARQREVGRASGKFLQRLADTWKRRN